MPTQWRLVAEVRWEQSLLASLLTSCFKIKKHLVPNRTKKYANQIFQQLAFPLCCHVSFGENRSVTHVIQDLKFCDVAVGIWPVQKGLPELMNLIGVILSLACYLSCPWNKTALHVKSLIGRRGVGPNPQNITFFYRKLEAGLNFCALTTTDESNLSVWIFWPTHWNDKHICSHIYSHPATVCSYAVAVFGAIILTYWIYIWQEIAKRLPRPTSS